MAAPVQKGEEVELDVDSLAYGGSGVGRVDGFVVFVRGALPGDRVRARVTKVKRGFAEAAAETVLDPSAQRVEAPCRHFGIGKCGGCRFQDLAYDGQIAAKEQQVRDALIRIGRIEAPPVEPIVPAASLYHYRNKLEYSFSSGDDGEVELGLPPRGPLGRGHRHRGVPPHDGPRKRDPPRRAGLGPRGEARAVRPGDR